MCVCGGVFECVCVGGMFECVGGCLSVFLWGDV